MKVIYGIGHLKIKNDSCVAMGVFDGLHRGHQFIIKKTVFLAKKKKLQSVVLTFHPHPDSIIRPRSRSALLMSLKHRLNLIGSFGVDICVVVKFNANFRQMEARDFVSGFLVKRCHMKYLVVNREFIFGRNKEGTAKLLRQLSKDFNFDVHFQKVLKIGRCIISSTLIRSLIMRGNLDSAARLLGRRVEVMGTVVGGDSRGRELGFSTANIDPHHEVIPSKGVYLIKALLGKGEHVGLANIGFRPTFKKDKKEIIELHLLNFKKNIYGRDVTVIFIKRLRPEIKFRNRADLIDQINQDIQKAHSFFSI